LKCEALALALALKTSGLGLGLGLVLPGLGLGLDTVGLVNITAQNRKTGFTKGTRFWKPYRLRLKIGLGLG